MYKIFAIIALWILATGCSGSTVISVPVPSEGPEVKKVGAPSCRKSVLDDRTCVIIVNSSAMDSVQVYGTDGKFFSLGRGEIIALLLPPNVFVRRQEFTYVARGFSQGQVWGTATRKFSVSSRGGSNQNREWTIRSFPRPPRVAR
jgi:hypothetical protein